MLSVQMETSLPENSASQPGKKDLRYLMEMEKCSSRDSRIKNEQSVHNSIKEIFLCTSADI